MGHPQYESFERRQYQESLREDAWEAALGMWVGTAVRGTAGNVSGREGVVRARDESDPQAIIVEVEWKGGGAVQRVAAEWLSLA